MKKKGLKYMRLNNIKPIKDEQYLLQKKL
jgi:hypothetical protein